MKSLWLALALLAACRAEEPATDTAAEAAREIAAEQERARLIAVDEALLQAALEQTRALAAQAESIELYEVANPFDADFAAWKGKPAIASYPIKRRARLDRKRAEPLLELLAARSTYFESGEGWLCLFEPHHVLELRGAGKRETIVICLKCGDVEFRAGGVSSVVKSVRPEALASLAKALESPW